MSDRFSGDPRTRWIASQPERDRKMELLADFWFIDPQQRKWLAPAGYVINGASIPRALWTMVGSPYCGMYRRASIVHDKACDDAGGNAAMRKAADRMFFHACRAGGCSIFDAIILYAGVRIGARLARPEAIDEGETLALRIAPSPADDRLQALLRDIADDPALRALSLTEGNADAALDRVDAAVEAALADGG